MSRQLFSHNPALGLTKYWHYDEHTDQATIQTVYDEEPLIETNKQIQNNASRLDRWGDGVQHVASVPMHIYGDWLARGLDKDQAHVKKWLNDPENRKYRSKLGRV